MRIWAKPQLKILRAKRGFTAKALAEELGLSRQWWTEVENRRKSTSPETAQHACRLLGAEFDELFEIEP
jgi:transcriptional regulator with XRE-family HTH domain